MNRQGEMRALARRYRRLGWTIEHGGKHMKWYHPVTGEVVVVPTTPGDHRTIDNVRADLRRADRRARAILNDVSQH